MTTGLQFRFLRAGLVAMTFAAIVVALAWSMLPAPGEGYYYEYGWPHEAVYWGMIFEMWAVLFGPEGEPSTSFLNPFRYIPTAFVVLCGVLAAVLLYVAERNRQAWLLGSSLALGAVFLSATFALRPYDFLITGRGVLIFDVLLSLIFASGLYLFAKLFSIFPEELDLEAAERIEIFDRLAIPGPPKIRVTIERIARPLMRLDRAVSQYIESRLGRPSLGLRYFESPRWLLVSGAFLVLASVLFNLFVGMWTGMFHVCALFVVALVAFHSAYLKMKSQYILGGPETRRQIEWLYASLWITLVAGGLFGAVFFVSDILDLFGLHTSAVSHRWIFLWMMMMVIPVGFLLFLAALMWTLFYRGAMDPRLVIRKSSLYALIAMVMTILFVVLEGTVTSQVVVKLGMPSETGAIIAGSLTALIFGPVRNRVERGVQAFVDRLLPPSALAEGMRYSAVVAFNDLSGYTRLMEEDETKALTLASLFHKEGAKAARVHNGRVVKTIGDAVLMEFSAVDDAIAAVSQFHRDFHLACEKMNLDRLPVHSGIHQGKVVKSRDGDIFGSTVNIAARLEGLAGPDEIVLSGSARQAASGPQSSFASLGSRRLKNVPEPIPCFKLASEVEVSG